MARNKKAPLIVLIILIIALPLLLLGIKQTLDNRSRAAAADKLEAEGGVLNGNATSQSDSSASNGSFVSFGLNPTSSLSPTNTPIPTIAPSTGLSSCTALDKGITYISAPSLTMPGYLQSTIDPTFGTKITRITGNPGTPIPNVSGVNWNTIGGSVYAKYPAWNADQSLIVSQNLSTPGRLFFDGNTYQIKMLRTSVPGYSVEEVRWHPTNPNIMIWVSNDGKAGHWNPTTNVATKLFDPGTTYTKCRIGPWEGNVSNNGNRLVINCGDDLTPQASFFAVDLSTGSRISPIITAGQLGYSKLDWASISPSGNYIVASQNSSLNKSLSFTSASYTERATWTNMGHYDLGLDSAGNEVAANARGYFVRLSDGVATNVKTLSNYAQYHTSTRNINATGWAYASAEGDSTTPLDNEIFAMELKSGGKIRRLTHMRSSCTTYDNCTYGSASPDGKRVFYRSDWGNSTGPVYGFIVDTRNICP